MRTPLLALALAALACSSNSHVDNEPPVTDCAQRGRGPALPAAICTAGTRWTPGTKAFVERTHEWGLDTLKVQGMRLSVADIDHDGFPDLAVRNVGVRPDDLKDGGTRTNWLLHNTGHGTFEDVSVSSGVLKTRQVADPAVGRPGEIWVFGDADNDGDVDLFTGLDTEKPAASLGETSEVLLNDGKGHFSLAAADSTLRRAGQIDNPGGASWLDFDLDGRLDLWVPQNNTADGTFLQSRLYKGDGSGKFADVTEASGLKTADWTDIKTINEGRAHARAWAAAACDLNGDGLPELLTSSYGRAPNHLFQAVRGDAGTTFVNRSVVSGYAYDDRTDWRDNQFARCWCEANPTRSECEGVEQSQLDCSQPNWDPNTDTEPFRLGGNSATTVCADLDNDGDIDLVTSEIQHWWAGENSDHAEVLVNTGEPDVKFERPGRESMGIEVPHTDPSGWNEGIMTAGVFDFDNDGWPDIYWGMSDYGGNHGLLLHQKSKLQFETVPVTDGIDHHRSHGIVFADFDRDGDLDVVVGHSRSRCDPNAPDDCYPTTQVRYFENVMPHGNWVQLELEGCDAQTNREAIGARVVVTTPDGVSQTQEVGGGFGHFGAQNHNVLHFGLGAACEAEVTVRWPNQAQSAQVFKVTAGHRFKVHESAGPVAADVAP